jgi:hypothetical protein
MKIRINLILDILLWLLLIASAIIMWTIDYLSPAIGPF